MVALWLGPQSMVGGWLQVGQSPQHSMELVASACPKALSLWGQLVASQLLFQPTEGKLLREVKAFCASTILSVMVGLD